MSQFAKATKEIVVVWKIVVVCDCGQANQYAVSEGEITTDSLPCGNPACSVQFSRTEVEALINAEI